MPAAINLQISDLTVNPSPALTDVMAIDNAAHVTYKQTAQQTLDLIQANIQIAESQVTNLVTDLAGKSPLAGSTSLVTVGTISTGTWQASVIDVSYGGTGVNTLTSGELIVGQGTSPVTSIAYSATSGVSNIVARDSNGNIQTTSLSLGGTLTSSSILSLTSTTLGFLPPVMTTTQKNAIVSPATGLVVYDNVLNDIYFWNGAAWVGSTLSGVTSVSGTSNRITTSPTTGDVIVDIAATYVGQTSITTLGTVATGTWNASVVAGQYGGTGVANTGLTITLASGAVGKVLASDVSGNATWQALSGLVVSSITGTANQIAASASTGAVTLSLTNGISIGSYQANSPPSGGIIAPGKIGFGTNTPGANFVNISATVSAAGTANSMLIGGTLTALATSDLFANIRFNSITIATGASSFTGLNMYGLYIPGSVITATGNGTFTNFASINSTASSFAASNAYNAIFRTPTGGTTCNISVFTDNLVVGASNLVVSPPANGAIIQGRMGIGNTGSSSRFVYITSTITAAGNIGVGLALNGGTITLAANNDSIKNFEAGTLALTTGASSFTNLIFTNIRSLNSGVSKSGNGTFTNAYGVYSDAFATLATNQYSGYFLIPTGGTVNTAIYSDNVVIGSSYVTNNAPSNGLMVQGQVLIGTTSSTGSRCVVQGASSDQYTLRVLGTVTGDDSTKTVGILIDGTIQPTNNSKNGAGLYCVPTITPTSTNTIPAAYGIYSNPTFTPASGVITASYAGYFVAPASGSSKTALFADNLAIGYTATTPPTNGIIVSGTSAFGSSGTTNGFITIVSPSSTTKNVLFMGGTQVSSSSAACSVIQEIVTLAPNFAGTMGDYCAGFYGANTHSPQSGCTSQLDASVFCGDVFAPASGGVISSACQLFLGGGAQSGAGSVTNGTAAIIYSPLYGTQRIGVNLIGNDSAGSALGTQYLLLVQGTMTGNDGARSLGILLNPTIRPTTNNRDTAGIWCVPTFQAHSTNTMSNAYGIYCAPAFTPGSGTITNAYSGMFLNPGAGSVRIALYSDNMCLGYAGTTPPTNGALISGTVSIGSATNVGSKLNVTSGSIAIYESTNTAQFVAIQRSGSTIAQLDTSNGGCSLTNPTATDIYIGNSSATQLNFRGSGWAIGNGTGAALSPLEVYENGDANNYDSLRIINTSSGVGAVSGMTITAGIGAAGGQLYHRSNNYSVDPNSFSIINLQPAALRFGVNNVEYMRLTGVGAFSHGNASPTSYVWHSVQASTSFGYALSLTGSTLAVSGSYDAISIFNAMNLTGPASGSGNAQGLYTNCTYTAGAGTIDSFYHQYTGPGSASTTRVTNGYQHYIDALATGTNRWGLYVKRPSTTGASVATTAYFEVSATGSVGIGATNPQAPLHIITNGFACNLRLEGNASDSVSVLFYQNNVQKYLIYVAGATSTLLFSTGVNTTLSLDANYNVVCNNTSNATNATNGFLYIASCAGTPTGVPTSYSGRVPMTYDSTNNKLYVYNGAWKGVTLT